MPENSIQRMESSGVFWAWQLVREEILITLYTNRFSKFFKVISIVELNHYLSFTLVKCIRVSGMTLQINVNNFKCLVTKV